MAPHSNEPWRSRLRLFGSLEAVAVAAWLAPASIHIVGWPAGGPVRLALLAPAWQLALWLAAGGLLTLVLIASKQATAAARVLAPVSTLWLLAVPYLPWLPDRVPLLLVLSGPIRWAVVVAALAFSLRAWRGAWPGAASLSAIGQKTVFAVSLAVYLTVGLWSTATNGIGGDEPHYLVIVESLLRDGDLQIENNHQRGDYKPFFGGDLRPDFMQRGLNGQIYSIHAPGLPVLLLPAYAAAGARGATAFICLLAALTALAIYDLAFALAGGRAALWTWAGVCLSVPFVPHSWAIFPEMPGALLVAWGALWLLRSDDPTALRWFVRGLALAVLPWLHTKFIVFLAIFAAGFGLKLWRSPRRLAALAAPIAISCAAWLLSFYVIYGEFDPEAPYGAYTSIYVLTRNIPHGLLGLFFDQKFGLLFYAPVYLASIAGAWYGVNDKRLRTGSLVLLLTIAAYVGSTARLYMFWGGSSAPARFFVPLLPCLAPFVALAIERLRSTAARSLVGLWLAIGLGIAVLGVVSPSRLMLFSDPHGRARVLEWLQAGSPLAFVVPTFTEPEWASEVGRLAAWLVAAGIALAVAFLAARSKRSGSGGLAVLASTTFLLAGGVLTATPSEPVRTATASRGAIDVLWRFDGSWYRTFDYQTLSRASADRLRELTTVRLNVTVPSDARAPFETSPMNLPPGVFEASVWFKSPASRQAEVLIADQRAVFGRTSGTLGNPARFDVDLPVAARRVVVRVPDLDVARAVSEVQLTPRSVVPPSVRDDRPVLRIESLSGGREGLLVYTDREAYPEMGTFWTRGTAATTVLVAPRGASRMTLVLSTGPMAGEVEVTAGAQTRKVQMAANQIENIAFDLSSDQRLVPLTVRSNVMFRPAEVDPASKDTRGLGCQVRLALE
jgi:hypothetical protein